MGGGIVGRHRGGVSSASSRFAGRFAVVAARRLVANIGRAWRPARFSAVEENVRSRGEKGLCRGSPGELASAGADPAAALHQRPGSACFGSRPVEVEVVNRVLRTKRLAN